MLPVEILKNIKCKDSLRREKIIKFSKRIQKSFFNSSNPHGSANFDYIWTSFP